MAYVSENGGSDKVDFGNLKAYTFELGPIRPPSEGGSFSLLLRVTRNCPWNRCTFCFAYKGEKFSLRSVDEVKADIEKVKAISAEINKLSWKLGYAGKIEPLASILGSNLFYGKDLRYLTGDELSNFYCLVNVFNWLVSGSRTAFLQDADSPILYTNQLVEVIGYLKETFSTIERVTSYARSKTLARKKPEELRQLHQVGLSRLHIGLETGDDDLLKSTSKGVTAEEQILAGKKAMDAGFEVSEYVMPGLGGKSRWIQHARNTARVLSEISPHFIRLRPVIPKPNTQLFEEYQRGEFELTSPHERLREIRLMVENLEVTSRVCFDHNMNASYWSGNSLIPLLKQDYNGYKFPEEKEVVLKLIDSGLKMDERIFLDVRNMVNTSL